MGLLVILLLAVYSFSDVKFGWDGSEIRKADFASLYQIEKESPVQNSTSVPVKAHPYNPATKTVVKYDADAPQNFLFFGDSMLEGLTRRFIDYADENGHELNTVIWYSSTSRQWAESDTLEYFIRKIHPTYIVVCLGSNELFVKDVPDRQSAIRKLIAKMDTIPFVWISPPNWKEDTGINDAIISEVGYNRYFDSRNLQLERGQDHAHPTFKAAAVWMDSVARWMGSGEREFPVVMRYPSKNSETRNITILSPE